MHYQQVIQSHPGHSGAYEALGDVYARLRRNDEAARPTSERLTKRPTKPHSTASWPSYTATKTAMQPRWPRCNRRRPSLPNTRARTTTSACSISGRPSTRPPQTQLERAVELNPAYGDAYYQLGQIHSRLGRNADAEASLRAALEHQSEYAAQALSALGAILLRQGRGEEAEKALLQAVQADPLERKPCTDWGRSTGRARGRKWRKSCWRPLSACGL